ncbi:DUF2283 domain-containing protein [Pseudonocardia sp. ICBG1142]|uniref:DUF2283 domain-containing protein n=1 Tax=Pseudonocardia sp. ICBG1142 TaxID=2846760 RepID=UPI001CF71805|nr:DUF2283 domain-containing protein [Pseudonocardia sp. ICBG1142]
MSVTLELDTSGDVAYLRFERLSADDARRVRTALVEDRQGVMYGALDFENEGKGRMVGLEILNASKRLPGRWLSEGENGE